MCAWRDAGGDWREARRVVGDFWGMTTKFFQDTPVKQGKSDENKRQHVKYKILEVIDTYPPLPEDGNDQKMAITKIEVILLAPSNSKRKPSLKAYSRKQHSRVRPCPPPPRPAEPKRRVSDE